jgi:hypothetical protein
MSDASRITDIDEVGPDAVVEVYGAAGAEYIAILKASTSKILIKVAAELEQAASGPDRELVEK